MTKISQYKVSEEKLDRLYNLFCNIIRTTKNENELHEILDILLTPTEKVMIAKRMAMIYLLQRKLSQSDICSILHVSSSTIAYWALIYKNRAVDKAFIKIIRKENISHFLHDIFADIFIQPGIRKGHWQLYWDDQRRRQKKRTGGL